jgi:hypothetical protein
MSGAGEAPLRRAARGCVEVRFDDRAGPADVFRFLMTDRR